MKFSYRGSVSASKSILNRALIVQSFNPQVKISGDSNCEDVRLMKAALSGFQKGERRFECGQAGTTFRFLTLRLSREPGEWALQANPRLLSRPQTGLFQVLDQLSVEHKISGDSLILQGRGWKPVDELVVDSTESSQFLSSVLLNAWQLPFDLNINGGNNPVSENYFHLTRKVTGHFGMNILMKGQNDWCVPAEQAPRLETLNVEPDVSSCFALAACAVFAGELRLENFPATSWQPDAVFRDILTTMGASWFQEGTLLTVQKSSNLGAISVDIKNAPDLFPVLAVLLARAGGVSRVSGGRHLVHKESNRIENTKKLLDILGRSLQMQGDDILIHGEASAFNTTGHFDPDQDHRMAMAAQVANFGGAQLNILNKDVVDKSFPEFWKITGGVA